MRSPPVIFFYLMRRAEKRVGHMMNAALFLHDERSPVSPFTFSGSGEIEVIFRNAEVYKVFGVGIIYSCA